MNSGWACKVFTSIIVINFFMMEMLKRVRWLALAPFMSVMITIPLMSSWSVHFCRRQIGQRQHLFIYHLDCRGDDHLTSPHQVVEVDLGRVDLLPGRTFDGHQRTLYTAPPFDTWAPSCLSCQSPAREGRRPNPISPDGSCKVWTLILKTNHQSLCVHQVSNHLSQRQVWIPVVKPFWTFALHCMEVVQLLLFSTLWKL